MSIPSYKTQDACRRAPHVCRILANTNRYNIFAALLSSRSARKELCVSEIAKAVGMSQSAMSHQLALLEAYGVVEGEKMGQTTCYTLTSSPLTKDIERVVRLFQPKS